MTVHYKLSNIVECRHVLKIEFCMPYSKVAIAELSTGEEIIIPISSITDIAED